MGKAEWKTPVQQMIHLEKVNAKLETPVVSQPPTFSDPATRATRLPRVRLSPRDETSRVCPPDRPSRGGQEARSKVVLQALGELANRPADKFNEGRKRVTFLRPRDFGGRDYRGLLQWLGGLPR